MTILLLICLGVVSYQVSYALFASAAANVGNSFTAASQFPVTFPVTFPSSTPTPALTPTPTPTSTITPTVTPTPPTSGPQPGDVVINEINWAGSFNINDEWIELRNTTANPIDLSGWNIDGLGSGSSAIVISNASTIAGNGLFLISHFAQTSLSTNLNAAPDNIAPSISLSNTSEQLILKTATTGGTVIDIAGVSGGDWFAGSNIAPKKSMERNSTPGDGTVAGSWHSAITSVNLDSGATESATPRAAND